MNEIAWFVIVAVPLSLLAMMGCVNIARHRRGESVDPVPGSPKERD